MKTPTQYTTRDAANSINAFDSGVHFERNAVNRNVCTYATPCGKCTVTCTRDESDNFERDTGTEMNDDTLVAPDMLAFINWLCAHEELVLYATQFAGITPDKEILDAVETGFLVDTSWHNDSCASFRLKADAEKPADEAATLWVNYDDVSLRGEDSPTCKYYVTNKDSDSLYSGDNAEAALAALLPSPSVEKAQRFVLAVGDYSEAYPDMPDNLPTCIYDRQEKKIAVTIHAEYAQAICLETTCDGGESAPFTNLENWLNNTSNEAFESEGLAPTLSLRVRCINAMSELAERHLEKAEAICDKYGAEFDATRVTLAGLDAPESALSAILTDIQSA